MLGNEEREERQQAPFWQQAISDRRGASSIRICLIAIIFLCVYAVGVDVTCEKKLTGNSMAVLLALIGFLSGGYMVSKKMDKDIEVSRIPKLKLGGKVRTTGDEDADQQLS